MIILIHCMNKKSTLKAITGFIMLFISYHAAEYMMMYKNSAAGFLGLLFVFFIIAWLIAKWQDLSGLSAWGLTSGKEAWKKTGLGLLAGGVVYTLYFVSSISLDIEQINSVPSLPVFLSQFLLFTFGTFFASLSEDILTRGYLYQFLKDKMSGRLLILLSSLIYVLNHIHRLQEGWLIWTYLFIIGLFLILAMLRTSNIWLTLGLHWSGNIVYQTTNNIIHTVPGKSNLSGIGLYILFLLLLIPVTYLISRNNEKQSGHISQTIF